MSGANDVAGDITLEELSRLIRILGMLGSASDGEALAAARFAQRWVREHRTSWEVLLVPPADANPVTGVAVAADAEAEADRAYRRGFDAGLARGAQEAAQAFRAQAAAQAAMASQLNAAASPSRWSQNFATGAAQSPYNAAHASAGQTTGLGARRPVRAPGAPAGGYQAGSWQAVAQELLDRHAQGIPGVFRGSREADFVQDVLARGFAALTPGQETWLRDIAGRSGMSW